MKKNLSKAEEAQLDQSIQQYGEFMMERLDLSGLMDLRGGGENPPVDPPKGNNGKAIVCVCA